ncbi:MAG TPA: hypothetical protein VEI03_16915 [Stellaceae bacterium]|nr:hypothetical protein [Stellaceae bacterium]
MTLSRNLPSLLAKTALALALAGVFGAPAAPSWAEDRDRHHPPPPRHHHPPGWRPHPVVVAPAPVYAPPAVVYAPPAPSPGINLIIPLNIR